jgi:hypothetical protein
MLIEDTNEVAIDVDAAAGLIELVDADNACLQPGNVIDARERTVFPGLAG